MRRQVRVIIAFMLMLGTANLAVPMQVLSTCYIATLDIENEDDTDQKSEKEGRESKDNQNEEDDREMEELEKDYFGSLHQFEFSPDRLQKLRAFADRDHHSIISDIRIPPPKA